MTLQPPPTDPITTAQTCTPATPPLLPARRAYRDLALVYVLVFGATSTSSVAYFAYTCGLLSARVASLIIRWCVPWQVWLTVLGWALVVALAEQDLNAPATGWIGPLSRRRKRLLRAALAAGCVAALWMAAHAWQLGAGENSWRLPRTVMLLALLPLLLRRHGVRPGEFGLRRRGPGDGARARRAFTSSLIGISASAVVASVIQVLAVRIDPSMLAAQAGGAISIPAPGLLGVLKIVGQSLSAGIAEELVLTALLVTVLTRARRPRAELLAVAVAGRIAFHLYTGIWGFGAGVFAAANVTIFLRTRRILPIVIAHAVYDATVEVHASLRIATPAGLLLLAAIGLGLGADLGIGVLRRRVTGEDESAAQSPDACEAADDLSARRRQLSLFAAISLGAPPEPAAGAGHGPQPWDAAGVPTAPGPRRGPDRDER
jgi:hypothetical protein